jgi:HemY protein
MPGAISVVFAGKRIEASLLVGGAAVLVLAAAIAFIWSVIRFVFRIPGLWSITWRARRRHKGQAALSRGLIAVGSGDAKLARRQAADALRLLGKEPLSLLLAAQAAQLSGERRDAETAFRDMLETPETKLLGLRGLFVEAKRRGDEDAAHGYSEQAATLSPAAMWANEAILEYHGRTKNWQAALGALDRASRMIDRATFKRHRAVLLTALAMAAAENDPDVALDRAREAVKLAPDLVPASVLLARIYAKRGEFRKASKVIEAAWKRSPHPELGVGYLAIRSGDAARERIARAEVLFSIQPGHSESRLLLAETAIEAREFDRAREVIEPLSSSHPTVRTCLIMAELEEIEHGNDGLVKEWLARASRAPRDPLWIADGVMSDHWAPVSPVTGRLDAFLWMVPVEAIADRRLAEALDANLVAVRSRQIEADKTGHAVSLEDDSEVDASQSMSRVSDDPGGRPRRAGTRASAKLSGAAFARDGMGGRKSDQGNASPPRIVEEVVFPITQPPDDPGIDAPDIESGTRYRH